MENEHASEWLPSGTEPGPPPPNFDELLKPSILVVDDDERGLFAMAEVLRDETYHVVMAHSGDEALKCLLKRDFAAILMDVRMPGLSGYETATLIRHREKTRAIPIIFMTAFNKDDVHVFEGYSAGAVDYLFKPIKPEILKAKASVFADLCRSKAVAERNAEAAQQLYEALRRSKEEQSLVLQLLPIALYKLPFSERLDAPRFVRGNVERLTGFLPDRFLNEGGLWLDRMHPEDRDRALREFARVGAAGAVTVAYRWERQDGAYRHFLDQAVLVRDNSGRGELFGVWLDISDRKQLEERLHHAQRLEKLGMFTGGIAHDFGNLLTAIIGSLDRLEMVAAADMRINAAVAAAQRAARRGEHLIQLLLAFSRQRTLHPKVIDLADHLRSALDLLRGALGAHTGAHTSSVEIEISPELWPVYIDGGELELALLNVASNARDAMLKDGVLRITAENRVLEDSQVDGLAGDFVALELRDTGEGIAPEVLRRVVEPFFTTKSPSRGTGLGLSQVYGFAKQSGGTVEIDSEVGRGTRVTIYLPRSASGPV